MEKDLFSELNISQKPALELLQKMGYTYLSPDECILQRGSLYNVLLKGVLREQLKKLNRFNYDNLEGEFSSANIEKAIEDLDEPLTDGLVKTSEKIYDALLLGKSYPEIVGSGKVQNFNLKYIDWENIENNVFHVTEEYHVESVDKQHNARPDIVLFVNGIPFAVIECKKSDVSVDQGIEQTIRNQKAEYIPHLYKYVQIVVSTNKNNVKYATTNTPKKFWSIWKEQDCVFLDNAIEKYITGRVATVQDKNIISLFTKERLLELTKYFVLFDANVKKICRYQQYFAVKEIIKTIDQDDEHGNRQSGVIWHTQGSGKSLTMVMLAKYILMELSNCNPKVAIVSDRKELDSQIAKTFAHTRLNPARATSGKHLIELIKNNKADIITSIINKFNTVENSGLTALSRDIFILVDESHRSNYGEMAIKMRRVFPNACYIGFTGTPLMKKEKNTMTRFGKLIHKYTIKDGVDDKAIVPLIYEGRFVEQKVDEEGIDLWFEETTKRLTENQKQDLKDKWSSLKRLSSTNARIKRIALDINRHFLEGYKHTGFKAMLATNFKKDAIRYLEAFEQLGDLECAVVISAPDMREGDTDVDESTDDKVKAYWEKMMKQYGDAERYEEAVKNKFIDGEIDILIVCSKLLTGFDAPICQVLYIDKELKEHGLLQAIARTNRLMDGKDYGLIVDYRGLIKKLDTAMNMYSGAGLEKFDSKDLNGTITDIISVVGKLRESYTRLVELFSSIKNKNDVEELETYLADKKIREEFYNCLCVFGKNLNIVINSESAYNELSNDELLKYKQSFTFWQKLRRSVKIRYFDAIDNKEYEPLMQNLLDSHLSVAGLKQITAPVDILNKEDFEKEIDSLASNKAKADAIHSGMTKSISEKYDENPAYYDSFSKRIKAVLQEYKDRVINDAEYLSKMKQILSDYSQGKSEIDYPEKLKGNVHAQAFYGVIGAILQDELEQISPVMCVAEETISYGDASKKQEQTIYIKEDNLGYYISKQDLIAEIAIEITKIVQNHSMVDWTNNKTIHDKIAQDVDDLFYEYEKEKGIKVSFDVIDKVIENVKTVALRRF